MYFKKPTKATSRLKLFLYGETGTGKTYTALQFPKPAVIDTEKGTEHYLPSVGVFSDYEVMKSLDKDEIISALTFLMRDPGQYKTIVIDSFTKLGESITNDVLLRLRTKKGKSDYVLQPTDYRLINSYIVTIINLLLKIDLNVVVTCRVKDLYAEGELMKKIGISHDGPKKLPYEFDTVIQVHTDKMTGKFIGTTIKDRTNTLPKAPKEFEFSYDVIKRCFGEEKLERVAEPVNQVDELLDMKRINKTLFREKEIFTAGVIGETLVKLADLKLPDSELIIKISEDYFKQSLLDLTEDEAQMLLKDLLAK